MSVAGIIFLAKLHAYRAAVARGETEQAAVRFAAEAEYAEDKRLEARLALYGELVKALKLITVTPCYDESAFIGAIDVLTKAKKIEKEASSGQ